MPLSGSPDDPSTSRWLRRGEAVAPDAPRAGGPETSGAAACRAGSRFERPPLTRQRIADHARSVRNRSGKEHGHGTARHSRNGANPHHCTELRSSAAVAAHAAAGAQGETRTRTPFRAKPAPAVQPPSAAPGAEWQNSSLDRPARPWSEAGRERPKAGSAERRRCSRRFTHGPSGWPPIRARCGVWPSSPSWKARSFRSRPTC